MNILEQNLWTKIREGDLRSFELLFNTYYKGLYLYAYDLVRSKQDAEENVMDLFQALWSNREIINIHTSLKAYLFRSIHNQCINFMQRKEIVTRRNTAYLDDALCEKDQQILVKEMYALDRLIGLELEKTIEEAVSGLPDQCREVFRMNRFEQMKIRDIAARLNLSESTVKTQLFRAVDKLRQILKKYLE
jgi:RNA polymerase sigma-70 factor (ECF subfamily)